MTELFDPAVNSEYMPSQRVPNASGIFDAWARDSAEFRKANPPGALSYGPGEHETLDIFTARNPRGTVLFIHGGYWMAFYKDHFSYLAGPLLGAGWRVAVMSYDLTPTVTLAHIVGQARRATSLVARTFSGPLIVSGHSAGGHLAAMMHATDWAAHGLPPVEITAGIGISGLYDLAPLRHTELQPDLKLNEMDVQTLSPVHLKPTTDAPFLAAVGSLESAAFQNQTARLAGSWPNAVMISQDGRHHFDAPGELLRLLELFPDPLFRPTHRGSLVR